MLEFPVVQQRGFRNIRDGGAVTGFQLAVRSPAYRGLWLSQLRPATVTVDGIDYAGDQVSWVIGGRRYEQKEMAQLGDVHWGNTEPALLLVHKPGGLVPGLHEVSAIFAFSASYLPPRIDETPVREKPRKLVLVF